MAPPRKRWPLLIAVALAVVAVLVAVPLLLNTQVSRRGVIAKVLLPAGVSLAAAADSLEGAGVVRSAALFRIATTLTGTAGSTVVPGRYRIVRGTSTADLVAQLHDGRGRFHRLTIPEGWGIQQIVRLAHDSLGLDSTALVSATQDSARRARVATPAADVEGYLFPATYDFAEGITAGGVVDTMLLTFQRRWRAAWDTTLQQQGRTRHAAVTLASIVEKEAGRASDRPLIAGVYLNRLTKGMRLQADPTVLYAMHVVAKRVLFADLETVSPYNTYRVAGLPPGPIASPGTASLDAAIHPKSTNALFFVAFPDGHSQFSASFAEHTAAVKAARAARDSTVVPQRSGSTETGTDRR